MKQVRQISDEEFEYCLNDKNINGIIHTAAKPFRKLIESSEFSQLKHISLFTALSTFDGRKGCSFLTYLYKSVRWQYLGFLRDSKEECVIMPPTWFDTQYKETVDTPLFHLDLVDEPLIRDRFYGNMTLEEIAEKVGVSRETVRKRLGEALERLRNII